MVITSNFVEYYRLDDISNTKAVDLDDLSEELPQSIILVIFRMR